MNEPVAWTDGKGNYFDKNSFFPVDDLIPLYTQPQKYCPSEDNAVYEKGFIDGMAQMTKSAVHRAVEGMSAKTLTDEEIVRISETCDLNHVLGLIDFAREILKKASEK